MFLLATATVVLLNPRNPLIQITVIIIRGNSDDSVGTMNKQGSQMLVTFFRHIHENFSVAIRVLAHNQIQPCSKVTAILKFSSFANSSNTGRGRFRINTFPASDCLNIASISLSKRVYTTTEIVKEIIEFCNRSAHTGT